MNATEKMTVDRVLTEIISLRRDVSGDMTAMRAEFNEHFKTIDLHLTGQDDRLRVVEIAAAIVRASDDIENLAHAERMAEMAESRISRRWIVTTMVALGAGIVGAVSIVVKYVLPS